MTSKQVGRQKRAAERVAQRWLLTGGVSLALLLMVGNVLNPWVVGTLMFAVVCALPVGIVAQIGASKLGRMSGYFDEGLCPYCAARVVEAWRVNGEGVRCPECGLDQGVVEQLCRGCGYDMQGCPTLACEPVTRMNCGRCKGVYVRED